MIDLGRSPFSNVAWAELGGFMCGESDACVPGQAMSWQRVTRIFPDTADLADPVVACSELMPTLGCTCPKAPPRRH